MDAVPKTITSALKICEALTDTNNIILNGSNDYERIANEVLNDKINTCIDLKFYDIDKCWKTYGSRTVAEGHITIIPRRNVNIRNFSIGGGTI